VSQCQPLGKAAFVKGLIPFFNGTVNICSHGKSHFNKKSFEKLLLSF